MYYILKNTAIFNLLSITLITLKPQTLARYIFMIDNRIFLTGSSFSGTLSFSLELEKFICHPSGFAKIIQFTASKYVNGLLQYYMGVANIYRWVLF